MGIRLTKSQQEAARHYTGPAIVVAGPGSGKTRVLIERIKFLITEKGVAPERIAVTTFTEKATGEIKNRLAGDLGERAALVHVSTIHSLCRFYLETLFTRHELGVEFSVLSAEEQELLINSKKSAWKLVGAGGWRAPLRPYYHSGAVERTVAELYGLMTANGISAARLIGVLSETDQLTHDLQRVIESYDSYCAYKREEKLVDFDELLRRVYDLLTADEEARETLKSLFDFYLIDEYQDTDPLQDAIFRLVTEEHRNIFVVGDVNQSIYGFRGASVANFREFTVNFPTAATYYLVDNFRSTATIVEAANRILEGELEKELQARRERGNPLILVRGETSDGAVAKAVEYLTRMKTEERLESFGDVAVLGRTNRSASDFIPFLERESVPYIAYGDGAFFNRPEIRSHIYFLSYIFQQEINDSKYLSWEGWWRVDEFAGEVLGLSEDGKSAVHAFEGRIAELNTEAKLTDLGFHNPADRSRLLALNRLRESVAQAPGKVTLLDALYRIFEITGYLKRCLDDPARREIVLNIAYLTELVGGYIDSMQRPSIIGLLNFLHEKTRQGKTNCRQIESAESVKLMTVHRSKGLEFPFVVIPKLTEGGFPLNYRRSEMLGMKLPPELLLSPPAEEPQVMHYAEELRLFYVAITRAQDCLMLLTSNKINTKNVKESRFLDLVRRYVTEEVDEIGRVETRYTLPQRIHQISYSSLNIYKDCPFRYWLVYEAGFRSPELYTQKLGIIIHNVLQMINNDLQAERSITGELIDEYLEKYWLTVTTPAKKGKKQAELKKRFFAYLEHFNQRYEKVLAVEKPFSYVGDRVIIKGKADLIARTREGLVELVDFKATNREGLERFSVAEQLNLYRSCLAADSIDSLAAYAFNDGFHRNYPVDQDLVRSYLETTMRGIRDNEYPMNLESDFHQSGTCPFNFLCEDEYAE